MKLSGNSYTALINGKQVTFRYAGVSVPPPFKDVTSVSVIPFTKDGNIVAVRLKHRGLDIPGGHVEKGEATPLQTLTREVMEEAGITILDPVLVEVIESDYFDHPSYMLLYGALVDEFHEFLATDEEMSEGREVVSQEGFIRSYQAGDKRLMGLAVQAAWQQLKDTVIQQVPVYTIHLPKYRVTTEPDHKGLGKIVDAELKKHFMGQTVLVRALGSQEHPGKSVDEIIEIIKTTGTDRYDPQRIGDRYTDVDGKRFDLCALRRTISARSKIFWQLSWSFYRSPLKERGYPVKIDILTIYDPKQLKAVTYRPVGQNGRVMRDGFVFRDPANKTAAIKAIFKIAGDV